MQSRYTANCVVSQALKLHLLALTLQSCKAASRAVSPVGVAGAEGWVCSSPLGAYI